MKSFLLLLLGISIGYLSDLAIVVKAERQAAESLAIAHQATRVSEDWRDTCQRWQDYCETLLHQRRLEQHIPESSDIADPILAAK